MIAMSATALQPGERRVGQVTPASDAFIDDIAEDILKEIPRLGIVAGPSRHGNNIGGE
jgi:hypothetical protein